MRIFAVLLLMLIPLRANTQDSPPRFETGIVFSGTKLREIGSSDSGTGTSAVGLGGRLSYTLSSYLDAEEKFLFGPTIRRRAAHGFKHSPASGPAFAVVARERS
jgi:hypothetical protein